MKTLRPVILLALASTAAFSQPLISARGVVNAASFMPPGLPSGAIAQGSIFSIFGARLGPDASPALAFPLATALGGVSVRVVAPNGAGVDAIPLFVSPGQINAIMPSNAPLGMVSVQVTYNNQKGNLAPVRVAANSFGAFAVRAGIGPGIVQNFNSNSDQPINSPLVAAKPGQAVILWGTGLGPAGFPDNVAPTAGNLSTRTEVFVGGKAAGLLYNGRTPCCAGVDQLVFTVPNDAPAGCWVPVTVRTAGATPSNTVTMAISPDGSPCSDAAFNPLAKSIAGGGKFGSVLLLKTVLHEDVDVTAPGDIVTDNAVMNFRQENAVAYPFNPLFSLPPPGTCASYGVTGDLFAYPGVQLPLSATTGKYLDPAALFSQLTGPGGSRMVMKPAPPFGANLTFYQFGKNIPGSPLKNSAFLQPGTYQLNTMAGADVGAFTTSIPNPQPVAWTNPPTNVDRGQPLQVNWSGGAANLPVAILGGNVDVRTNSTTLFACLAPAGANSFAVPAYILANVPATRPRLLDSRGVLYVGSMPLPGASMFSAAGIDFGIASATTLSGKTVIFK